MLANCRKELKSKIDESTFFKGPWIHPVNQQKSILATMQLLKALAIYTMAMLSPPGGHIGPELVAAASAVAEDWKDDALVSLQFIKVKLC